MARAKKIMEETIDPLDAMLARLQLSGIRDQLDSLLDETVARRGWLVFLTHDVAPQPTKFGASPGLMNAALDGALRRSIEILPMRDALDQIGLDES